MLDGTGKLLFGEGDIPAENALAGWPGVSEALAGQSGELREMIAQAIEEVRRFSQALHQPYLEELGLVPALETLAREAKADFQVTGVVNRLKIDQELAIYRITQEALNNAHPHAQARRLRVEVGFEEEQVMVRVRDDGQGFEVPADLSRLTHCGHFGLIGMRERSPLVGGYLERLFSR